MKAQRSVSLKIEPSLCLGLAALLLLIPKWVTAWIVAVIVHESFHILAVFLCGGSIYETKLGFADAQILCDGMTPGRELFCTFAGPMGSLLLILFFPRFPRLAICGLFQGLYNLLPLLPMDGGRLLYQLFCGIFGMKKKTFRTLQIIICGFGALASAVSVFVLQAAWPLAIPLISAIVKNVLAFIRQGEYNRGIKKNEE